MAKSVGSAAKSSSRRCFTCVRVTTPTAPRTPLPTKFAVAEKHIISDRANAFNCSGDRVARRRALIRAQDANRFLQGRNFKHRGKVRRLQDAAEKSRRIHQLYFRA